MFLKYLHIFWFVIVASKKILLIIIIISSNSYFSLIKWIFSLIANCLKVLKASLSTDVNVILLCLRYLLFMKMAALQLMQQKANKDRTAALHDTSTADAQSESKPQAIEASEKIPDGTSTPPTSSESTLTPDDAKATNVSENSAPENQEAPADVKSEVPTANSNGTHEPSAAGKQSGGGDSPFEGKEADENIPGLAEAKELAESLAAEDGSGIGTSCERPKRGWEGTRARAGRDMHTYLFFFCFFSS